MRRRLMAIIGVAFCVGALTASWAARPWERLATAGAAFAEPGPAASGAPAGSVGTYGEAGAALETLPPPDAPVRPLPPPPDEGCGHPSTPADAVPAPSPAGAGAAAAAPALAGRLVIPVQGVGPSALQPMFHEQRGTRIHEAIDILAPRGTPVLAAGDGQIVKLFYSVRGGRTLYQFEPSGTYCYYYAHLDRYVSGLKEGQQVSRGQVIAYVGSTGNADAATPHLHFAIFRLGPERRWWEGTAIDPYPVLSRR